MPPVLRMTRITVPPDYPVGMSPFYAPHAADTYDGQGIDLER